MMFPIVIMVIQVLSKINQLLEMQHIKFEKYNKNIAKTQITQCTNSNLNLKPTVQYNVYSMQTNYNIV